MSIKAWIMTMISAAKLKVINPVPVKWVFKSKEEPDVCICLKLINVVKEYMKLPGFDFTDEFLSVTSDTPTRIMIGMNL